MKHLFTLITKPVLKFRRRHRRHRVGRPIVTEYYAIADIWTRKPGEPDPEVPEIEGYRRER